MSTSVFIDPSVTHVAPSRVSSLCSIDEQAIREDLLSGGLNGETKTRNHPVQVKPKITAWANPGPPVEHRCNLSFPSAVLIVGRLIHRLYRARQGVQARKLFRLLEAIHSGVNYRLRFTNIEMREYHHENFVFEHYKRTQRLLALVGVAMVVLLGLSNIGTLSDEARAEFVFWGSLVGGPVLIVLHEVYKLTSGRSIRTQKHTITSWLMLLVAIWTGQEILYQSAATTFVLLAIICYAASVCELSYGRVGLFQLYIVAMMLLFQVGTTTKTTLSEVLTLVAIMGVCQYQVYVMHSYQNLISLEIFLSKMVVRKLLSAKSSAKDVTDLLSFRGRRSIESLFTLQTQLQQKLQHTSAQARTTGRRSVIESMELYVKHEETEQAALRSSASERTSSKLSCPVLSRTRIAPLEESPPPSAVKVNAPVEITQLSKLPVQAVKTATQVNRRIKRLTNLSFDDKLLEQRFRVEYNKAEAPVVKRLRIALIAAEMAQALMVFITFPQRDQVYPALIIHSLVIVGLAVLPSENTQSKNMTSFTARQRLVVLDVVSKVLLLGVSSHGNFYSMQLLLAYIILFTMTSRHAAISTELGVTALMGQLLIITFLRPELLLSELVIALASIVIVALGSIASYDQETHLRIHFMLMHRRIERVHIMIHGTF